MKRRNDRRSNQYVGSANARSRRKEVSTSRCRRERWVVGPVVYSELEGTKSIGLGLLRGSSGFNLQLEREEKEEEDEKDDRLSDDGGV